MSSALFQTVKEQGYENAHAFLSSRKFALVFYVVIVISMNYIRAESVKLSLIMAMCICLHFRSKTQVRRGSNRFSFF